MKRETRWQVALIGMLGLGATYAYVRANPPLVRPHYAPNAILANPAGTCALAEYKFSGGERWSWMDPYALFTLSGGDAFYTVVDLRSGKILRDNTSSLIPIIAYSQESGGMGDSVFNWSRDGSSATFPGGEGPSHEWADIRECVGSSTESEFANADCGSDDTAAQCLALRRKLSGRKE